MAQKEDNLFDSPLEGLDIIFQPQILERYGPIPFFWSPSPLPDPPPTGSLLRQTRPFVEIKYSGFRTAIIIYHQIANNLSDLLSSAKAEELWRLAETLKTLQDHIVEFLQDNQTLSAKGLNTSFLTEIEQAVVSVDNLPPEARNKNWPFVSVSQLPAQDDPLNLQEESVFWLEKDLTPRLYTNDSENTQSDQYLLTRWDAERLQLAIINGFILFWSGPALPEVWLNELESLMTNDQEDGKATLCVLTTQYAKITNSTLQEYENYYLLYLPAPRFIHPPAEPLLPTSLQQFLPETAVSLSLQQMAEAWDTSVVEWADDEPPAAYFDKIAALRWATIDRQGATLSLPDNKLQETFTLPGEWRIRPMNVFYLPKVWAEGLVDLTTFEKTVRWRAEMEAGIIAGANAAFYRAGLEIQQQIGGADVDVNELTLEERAYLAVSKALQDPLNHLIGHIPSSQQGTIISWFVDDPSFTIKLTSDEIEINSVDLIIQDETASVIGGEALFLGLVTPLPEAKRILRQAFELLFAEILKKGIAQHEQKEGE